LIPRFRTDGTALFSLVRNIGSSIGISIVTVLLTRNIQINHAELSAGHHALQSDAQGTVAGCSARRLEMSAH
jgi:DHA2 family multidrug resistance protein